MAKVNREDDVGAQIMEERLTWGIDMVKEQAAKHNVEFDKDLFIKGVEVGISLYIQKERRG